MGLDHNIISNRSEAGKRCGLELAVDNLNILIHFSAEGKDEVIVWEQGASGDAGGRCDFGDERGVDISQTVTPERSKDLRT